MSGCGEQADEKVAILYVTAALPRHVIIAFNIRWRGNPAAASFVIILLRGLTAL
jgi:hypothetical protein